MTVQDAYRWLREEVHPGDRRQTDDQRAMVAIVKDAKDKAHSAALAEDRVRGGPPAGAGDV